MRKFFLSLSIFFAIFLAALIGISVYLRSIITEEFIVHQLEGLFNARVSLERFSIGILSGGTLSIEKLSLGSRDSFANRAVALEKRPPLRNKSLGIKNLDIDLDLFQLFKGVFRLNAFVLYQPEIYMTLHSNGGNNLSPLFAPPAIVRGKANPNLRPKPKGEPKETKAETDKKKEGTKSQPLKAQDIPLAASLGKIGIENGIVELSLQQTGDKVRIEGLDFLVKNIEFDPTDLANKNGADVGFNMKLLLFTKTKKETGRFLLSSGGHVVPFNKRTGKIDPNIVYGLLFKKDSYLSGFSVFEKLSGQMDLLKKANISINSLKGKSVLSRDAKTQVSYSRGTVTILRDTLFATKGFNFNLKKNARFVLTNLSHSMQGELIASQEDSDKAIRNLEQALQKNLKINAKEAQEMRKTHFQTIIKDSRIFLPFRSEGSLRNPDLSLKGSLPSIGDLAKDAAKKNVKRKGKEVKKKTQKKAKKKLQKEGKKLLKKLF